MGYFSPSCVQYVGDNIQLRTWLICRGGALAQLPPQSCICIWNDLHFRAIFKKQWTTFRNLSLVNMEQNEQSMEHSLQQLAEISLQCLGQIDF